MEPGLCKDAGTVSTDLYMTVCCLCFYIIALLKHAAMFFSFCSILQISLIYHNKYGITYQVDILQIYLFLLSFIYACV